MVTWDPSDWFDDAIGWSPFGGGSGRAPSNGSDFWSKLGQGVAGQVMPPRPPVPTPTPSPGGNGGSKGSFFDEIQQKIDEQRQKSRMGMRRGGLGSNLPPRTDPVQDLYEKLAAIIGGGQSYQPSPYQSSYNPMSLEDMQSRSESLVSSQYDPQIEAINRAMQQTQGRANTNKQEIGNMYQALSSAYEQDVPKVQQTYDVAQQEALQRQQQLQQQLDQSYNTGQQSVSNEAAALGQGEAANYVNQQMSQDEAFIRNLANTTSEQNNSNLALLENANVAYTQQGGRLAGLEGNNLQTDLMRQLEDYMQTQQGNIQGIQGQRQADYVKYLSDLEMSDRDAQMQDSQMRSQYDSQQQSMQAQQQAFQWQQMMELAGLQMQMAEANQEPEMSISDQIAAGRYGLDQRQADFNVNKTVMEMAMKIAEEQGISFEEAMQFVQSAMAPKG